MSRLTWPGRTLRRSSVRSGHNRRQSPFGRHLRVETLEERALLAGMPELLKDIYLDGSGSSPMQFIESQGTTYFLAHDALGDELWKTDGTALGTIRVSSNLPGQVLPWILVEAGGTFYVVADDADDFDRGWELWATDATGISTRLIRDINLGAADSLPSDLVSLNGTLYFTADDGVRGRELWRTDGTFEGTTVAAVFSPGGFSNPQELTVMDGNLYLTASDGDTTNGAELWKLDPVSGQVELVKRFAPHSSGSTPHDLIAAGNKLFFGGPGGLWVSNGTESGTSFLGPVHAEVGSDTSSTAAVGDTLFFAFWDADHGSELWKSNGTPASTTIVKDIVAGPGSSSPEFLTNVNGKLFFAARDAASGRRVLWTSDGTLIETNIVEDVVVSGNVFLGQRNFVAADETFFFQADAGSQKFELWKSDGTPERTERVVGMNSGSISWMSHVNGQVFMAATGPVGGRELWKTDGTAENTRLVKNINPGPSGEPEDFVQSGSFVYFTARHHVYGTELWRTDGTMAGTVLMRDINVPAIPNSAAGSDPQQLTDADGTLFFTADDGIHGRELWMSDGTREGTLLVDDLNPGYSGTSLRLLTNLGRKLVFFKQDEGNSGLWVSDGTREGTKPLHSMPAFSSFVVRDNILYFAAPDGLWRTNGTPSDTALVKALVLTPVSAVAPRRLHVVGGLLYFSGDDGTNGEELWISDGTAETTRMVKDINPGAMSSAIGPIFDLAGTAYFSANDGVHGWMLWKSDGTEPNTLMVQDVAPGSASGSPQIFGAVNGHLLFEASDGADAIQLWRTDGTAGGTILLRQASRLSGRTFSPIGVADGFFYFQGWDPATGWELWKTDGNQSSTVLVKDINPGAADSRIEQFVVANGMIYFRAFTDEHGWEMWSSNGADAGTAMLVDLYPGPTSGNQTGAVANVDGTLLFQANDGVYGSELWTIRRDDDQDGVGNLAEDGAPNGGDGNADGVLDSQQLHVTSLSAAIAEPQYVTIESGSGQSLVDVAATANPSPTDSPLEAAFPVGHFEFSVAGLAPGGSTTVTLYFPQGTIVNTYFKFGATSENTTPHWYEFRYDGTTGAEILGDRIVLHFVDGQRGDDDLEANGRIVDPGSPGFTVRPPVASAGGPYAATEGDTLTLDGSGSYDPDGDALTYSWDINGDGLFGDASGVSPTLTWQQLMSLGIHEGPSLADIRVRVDDGHGGIDTSPAAILVLSNAKPAVSLQAQIDEPRLRLAIEASDPSLADQDDGFFYAIDWGDGYTSTIDRSPGNFLVATSHLYAQPGTYSVQVTATDKDGAVSDPASQMVDIVFDAADIGPGSLDAEFGNRQGFVKTEIPDLDFSHIADLAVQTRGSGQGQTVQYIAIRGANPDRNADMVRYNEDGTRDTTFGSTGDDGFVQAGAGETFRAVIIDADGRIVVAGTSVVAPPDRDASPWAGYNEDFTVWRFDADGRPDMTFGQDFDSDGVPDGKATADFRWRYHGPVFTGVQVVQVDREGTGLDNASSVAIDSSGRIVVAGYTTRMEFFPQGSSGTLEVVEREMAVARFTPTGSLDVGFGHDVDGDGTRDGKAVARFWTLPYFSPYERSEAYGVSIRSGDRILLTGWAELASTNYDFALVALTASGDPDTSFGQDYDGNGVPDGKLTTNFFTDASGFASADFAQIASVDAEGRILAAGVSGWIHGSDGTSFALARYHADGSLDTTFGQDLDGDGTPDGKAGSFLVSGYDPYFDITVDKSNRFVVGGFIGDWDPYHWDFLVARYTAAGMPDTSFDGDGVTVADLDSDDDGAYAVAVDPEGRIIAGGQSRLSNGETHFAVVRYLGNAIPVADADGPYSVLSGGSVPLSAAGSKDADPHTVLTYTWDLDGDGVFGEIGSSAARGDEVGSSPTFSAAGVAPGTVTVTLRVQDHYDAVGEATATIEVQPVTTANLQESLPQDPDGDNLLELQLTTTAEVSQAVDAINTLASPAQPVEVILDLGGQTVTGQTLAPPANVTVIIINGELIGASPALIVESGVVVLLDSTASNSTDAPTILVRGGSLTVRNSTISESMGGIQAAVEITGGLVDMGTVDSSGGNVFIVNGDGEFIRNVSSGQVWAIGNHFQSGSISLGSAYFDIEDGIFHALDAGGGGLVTYVVGNVFVTEKSGSIQRGVDAVATGGTVHVATTSLPSYDAGAKLVTIAFENGPRIQQEPDALEADLRTLVVTGTWKDETIVFRPGLATAAVEAAVYGVPTGTFRPTGRLVAFGEDGADDIQVGGAILLSAWLYGGAGHDRLKGGAGHDVLLGGADDDLMVGGSGRDLLIGGFGADRIVGNADDDILIAGRTSHDTNPAALDAIMDEWTRTGADATYEQRIALALALLNSGTVWSDGDVDILTGSAGLDWFWFDEPDRDRATDLRDEVFAHDLDFILS
ncbi:MAG: hypothetical protein HUU20_13955 [Pirellulales bacterium]|nr:hypothetical protein [Pirellulales bacterium]